MPYEEEERASRYGTDTDIVDSVRRAVNKAGRQTVAELQRLSTVADKGLENDGRLVAAFNRMTEAVAGKGLENDERLVAAFNRMTEAITGLHGEIRALREELSPSLDKSPMLPAAAAKRADPGRA